MPNFKVTGIFMTGACFDDHNHEHVFDLIVTKENIEKAKEHIRKNLTIEIQLSDEEGNIIPLDQFKFEEWDQVFQSINLNEK